MNDVTREREIETDTHTERERERERDWAVDHLSGGFHHRTCLSGFIHQTYFLGSVAADYIGIIADSNEQRGKHGAVLETVSLLEAQHGWWRQQTSRLKNAYTVVRNNAAVQHTRSRPVLHLRQRGDATDRVCLFACRLVKLSRWYIKELLTVRAGVITWFPIQTDPVTEFVRRKAV